MRHVLSLTGLGYLNIVLSCIGWLWIWDVTSIMLLPATSKCSGSVECGLANLPPRHGVLLAQGASRAKGAVY